MFLSFVIWTTAFAFVAYKANSDSHKVVGKLYGFHLFLAWILLMLHSHGFKTVGWAIGNSESIPEYFYIPIGPLPAWFNLSTWVIGTAFSILAMLMSFSLVKRKEKARIWLIRVLPLFYILAIIEGARTLYKELGAEVSSIWEPVTIGAILFAFPFGAMLYFYRKENVKTQIFGANR